MRRIPKAPTARELIATRNKLKALVEEGRQGTLGVPSDSKQDLSDVLSDVLSEADLQLCNSREPVGFPPRDPCPIVSTGPSFCSGEWHFKRCFWEHSLRWTWAAFRPCPNQPKESAKPKPATKSKWRSE